MAPYSDARLSRALGAGAMVLVLSCADNAPTPPAGGDGVGTLHGSVTSSKTSAGVPNLVVALVQNGRVTRAAPTNESGIFDFGATPAGDYVVRLTGFDVAGIDPRFTSFDPPQFSVHVGTSSPTPLFFAAVGLIPPRIVGVVRCTGVPAAGARLRIVGGTTDEIIQADAQGKYAATDLDAGHYAVLVVDAPCSIVPAYAVAELKAGQMASVDFGQ